MAHYRQKHVLGTISTTATTPSITVERVTLALGYINLGLTSRLNVVDNDMNWEGDSTELQLVEQEYHGYAYSACSRIDTDLLTYWAVSVLQVPWIFRPYVMRCSFTRTNIPLSTPSPWTTSPFKPPPFLVNLLFSPAPKLIHYNVTESARF